MKTNILLSLAVFMMFIFGSCDKSKPTDVDRPLVFESLMAVHDTINPGGSTSITAIADGDGIQYFWSVTSGYLIGSGSSITYITTPCILGEQTVTCTIKDKADNSLSKSVTITVI